MPAGESSDDGRAAGQSAARPNDDRRDDRRKLVRRQVEGYLNLVRIHREIEARALALLADAEISGMTMAQATALLVLVQERRPITATRLAELLNVSTVTVGRFVRSLEQNGWIRRRADPADGRAMLIAPTEKTYDTLDTFVAVTEQLMDEAYAGFESEDVEELLAHLAELRKNLYRQAGKLDVDPQPML